MAITKVNAVSVGELLSEKLMIPAYQRPYTWSAELAMQLLDDLQDAQAQHADVPYVLGAVILHHQDGQCDVVDGQQRLLTLRMILSDTVFTGNKIPDTPVTQVWRELRRRLQKMPGNQLDPLRDFIRTQCQLVRIETDDVDEAFRVFDSQNYRGKPLAPHDLLKAHHLRAMQGESAAMKVAVVEGWEFVKDEVLDRLFSTFLYRIARWSRGESAPGFAIHDLGMFKGIAHKPGNALSPSERYHLAAQAAAPLLSHWAGAEGHSKRDIERWRFQLDAPLTAGRSFFEMVSFMQQELETLEAEVQPVFGKFGPSQGRYRYVHDLFIAALLYYTNKFGHENLEEARDKLFAWAYALRVERLRVQFASVDNRACGKGGVRSPFILLRNSITGRVVRQLNTTCQPYGDNHEQELVKFLAQQQENYEQ